MNKKQLIEILKGFPDDAEIEILDNHEGMNIGTITDVWFDNKNQTIILES